MLAGMFALWYLMNSGDRTVTQPSPKIIVRFYLYIIAVRTRDLSVIGV